MNNFISSLGLSGISAVLSALITLLICAIAIRIITKLVGKLLNRSDKLDGTTRGFIQTAVRTVLWVLAITIVASSLGIPAASLIAVISIAGLALSLSVQNILANLFSGITLLFTKPFREGDLVDIGANQGKVQSVGLFYTVLNTMDNRCVTIPNSDVTSAAVVNYTREPLRRVDLTYSASYDCSTESVRTAILEAAMEDDKVLRDPAPFIVIGAYKDSAVEYIVRIWCKNADYWDVYFGMNERVREAFARHNVVMTYSHINVHMIP